MDAALTWLGNNRDALIVALIGGVVLLMVAALWNRGTAILRRLRERQQLAKEQKKEREARGLERQQLAKEQKKREEERQRCQQQFRDSSAASWVSLPPETDVGQVIVGYLSHGYPHWKFREERVRGDVVDLEFAVKATAVGREIVRKPEDEGNELGPGERAAQKFHSGAEVTLGPFVDDPTVFGDPRGLAMYRVRIRVSAVPD